jgi:hypothetical protein
VLRALMQSYGALRAVAAQDDVIGAAKNSARAAENILRDAKQVR